MPEDSKDLRDIRTLASRWQERLKIAEASLQAGGDGWRSRSAERLRQIFFSLVPIVRPDLFVEAGACAAETSCRVKDIAPDCRCIALEPDADNFERYAPQLYGAGGVEYLNLAAWREDGTADFFTPLWSENPESHSLRLRSASPNEENEHASREVMTVRLDSLALSSADPERIAIWIDCEGCGGDVLEGCTKILARTKLIFVEVEDYELWSGQSCALPIFEKLLQAGFLPIGRDFEFGCQYNVLWASSEVVAEHSRSAGGAQSGGAQTGGAQTGGAQTGGAQTGGAQDD